jgi:uncharacterized membrane protein YbhN (UPF0104 family)
MPWTPGHPFLAIGMLCLACLATLSHFLMEPWRWLVCYLPAQNETASRARLRDTFFSTALASYLLPFKLGIPLRLGLLHRQSGLAIHFLGVIIAIDGAVSALVWAVITAIAAWLLALHWSPPWYLLVAGGVVVLLGLILLRARRGKRAIAHIQEALLQLDRPLIRLFKATSILSLDVLSYAVRHAALLVLITGEPSRALLGALAGIVATFTGIISGLPLGLVGYDATLIALLSLSGIGTSQAVAVVLLNRLLNLGCAALLGLPAAIRLGLGSGIVSIMRKMREMGGGKN